MAILLAFLLATHAFWCGLDGSDCEFDIVPSALRSIAHSCAHVSTATHALVNDDFCAGMDQTVMRAAQIVWAAPAPVLIWLALVFLAALLSFEPPQRAAIFDRDGPVCVPPLHSRLVRASLPHRAPPVSLI